MDRVQWQALVLDVFSLRVTWRLDSYFFTESVSHFWPFSQEAGQLEVSDMIIQWDSHSVSRSVTLLTSITWLIIAFAK
jgi:hypothetical protein